MTNMWLVQWLVRTIARRYARRAVAKGGKTLDVVESMVRADATDLPSSSEVTDSIRRAPFLLRLGHRLAPTELLDALRRGHYTALRKAEAPVWRSYRFRGHRVTHDIRHKCPWNAFVLGVHQPGVTHWLRELSAPGACVLDIGANVGVLTLELAEAVGPDGCVHAFEPNPEVLPQLRQSVDDNDLDHVVCVHAFALGTSDATMTLAIPEVNNGAASLRQPREGERNLSVEVRSFGDWWETQGCPRVDCVKLDVEGYEETLIEALSPMLRECRPGLVMELSPDRYDAAALVERLVAAGYRVMRVVEHPPFAVPLPEDLSRQMDIVCLPQSTTPA